MIHVQISALISGQRLKEDTNHSEHLTQTVFPTTLQTWLLKFLNLNSVLAE